MAVELNRLGKSLGNAPANSDALPDANTPPLDICFFGHDWTESTIRKRVGAFTQRNARVSGFMFKRRHDKPTADPSWENIELGLTVDGNYRRRLLQLLAAVPLIWRHRSRLRTPDVLYARNIDMLFLAFIGKHLARSRALLVYESLDVHPAFTKPGLLGRALRFAERRLLSTIALMVVSSQTFMDCYYHPVQCYRGRWFLLENKVSSLPEQAVAPLRNPSSPVVIGWFGVLRCRRSLDILQRLASRHPNDVVVHIRGLPSETDGITDDVFANISAQTPNIRYFGRYRNPEDLAQIYGAINLTWAVDFSASGANSDWLIPNRLYEGGLYGVPAIARQGTATGDMIENGNLGWALVEPFDDTLETFLSTLDSAACVAMSERIRDRDRSAFVDINDTKILLQELTKLVRQSRQSG